MKTYKIKEVFGPTIQGEGSYAGQVVMFIRFAGCNKWSGKEEHKAQSVCSFCDTDFVGGETLNALQIVERLKNLSSGVSHVVLTGGEPLLQLDLELLELLKYHDYFIHLETNGSKALEDRASFIDHVTMSPKQALSKTKLEYCNDLKLLHPFINKDISFDSFFVFDHSTCYVQPVMSDSYEENLKKTLQFVYENPTVKLSLQLHKILGVD